ncbi:hypothetical protein HanRHA438_Chr11g0498061 [Helianthus annuus]|nr:hypothetical protein HanHA300_Chr11g0397691 [Helianthus annuus]KAJ0508884.1 hypothetical protein HanIR_Chr11g0522351 [Helianthus annuus]KAJ0517064.1 hypothetical protein HanHA89_Chr11g0420981 [Helianthus annuus]KAJ0685073.1 hypothetical protein HanLR1_Chr11g0398401 [Helianthus annuus]KAJ0688991.1 hypothetical protein HanOQP8_Chr11g0400531 [Helianthus annuus]
MMKVKALDLKKKAGEADTIDGSSYLNFDQLVTKILLKSEVAIYMYTFYQQINILLSLV